MPLKPPARGKTGSKATADAQRLDIMTVAQLPAASLYPTRMVYVSNGASGQPCLAYSNGTNWLRITLGAAVAAS